MWNLSRQNHADHARFEQINAQILHIVLSNPYARDFHRSHFIPRIIVSAMSTIVFEAKNERISYCTCIRQQKQKHDSLGDDTMNAQIEVNLDLFHSGVEYQRF